MYVGQSSELFFLEGGIGRKKGVLKAGKDIMQNLLKVERGGYSRQKCSVLNLHHVQVTGKKGSSCVPYGRMDFVPFCCESAGVLIKGSHTASRQRQCLKHTRVAGRGLAALCCTGVNSNKKKAEDGKLLCCFHNRL